MGIFDRMGRVISSNVNALLDKAEDPKKNLDLILEEMRDQLRRAQKELVEAFATQKQLQKKVDDLDGDADKWARRAELALKADDEALAREALVQKKRVIAERDKAEALLAEARATTQRMKQELDRMDAKHKELEARKGTIAVRAQQAKAGGGSEALGARGGSAFDEFRRFEDQIDRVETEAAAQREVNEALEPGKARSGLSRDDLEAKFAALEGGGGGKGAARSGKGGPDVDDELDALKKKIRIST
ncbi:MAG TPA: PspA/IM30 family protein [Polyangiaceae bacterium]|nr:PspA/IM30 family protein [Polyangiaceae bacterium]